MSKIAEALAKARERTGQTGAPFPVGASAASPASAAALRRARRARLVWAILLPVAAVLTAWLLWRTLSPDAPPTPPPALMRAPGPATPPSSSPAPALPASNGPAPVPAAPAVTVAAPTSELYRVVNALVITAVLPGESPRLMHKGRIVQIGEVVEGELVFAGLRDGQLVFTDRRGATYLRRY